MKASKFNNYWSNPHFLQLQNIYFKLLVVIIGSIAALFLRWEYYLVIYGITLLWLMVGFRVIRHYLKILLSISPFFTSYLLLGLVFQTSLQEQFVFIGRIALLLLFSVFLLKTTTTQRFLTETKLLRRWKCCCYLLMFVLATGFFIQLFFIEIKGGSRKISKIDDVIRVIIDSFNNVYARVEEIENRVHQLIERRITLENDFYNWANVYLTFLLVLYICVLAL